jgi:hypothetical protein
LAREIHAAGYARGGVGFQEGGEDFEAEWVIEEDGGLGVLAKQADGGGGGRNLWSDAHSRIL